MDSGRGILILLIVVAVLIAIHFIRKKLKTVKIGAVSVISGAVKSGKSFLSVYFAHKQIRKNVFQWRKA